MLKIAHEKEVKSLTLPQEVKNMVQGIARTLDENYGEERHWQKDLGGIILILEQESDIEELKQYNLDKDDLIPEYVDFFESEEENWLIALILLSSDYSISLVMPMHLAPLSLLNQADNTILYEPISSYR